MRDLAQVVRLLSSAGDHLVIDAPVAWSQGRTLYGGMTASLCYEAAKQTIGVKSQLRSAQLLFTGPATGTLRFAAQTLRESRSTGMVAVECTSETGPAARAAFVFGTDRASQIDVRPSRDDLPHLPEQCPVFLEETGGFHDNFEMRLANGSALLSGGPLSFDVWVRYRELGPIDPVTALLAMADALPPAAMAGFPESAPISTVTWTLDVAQAPSTMNEWHLLRSAAQGTSSGYSTQTMALWDASGRAIAFGQQLVAIFV